MSRPASRRSVGIALGLWLAVAAVGGIAGIPARLVAPAPQLLLAGLSLATIAACLLSPSLKAWVLELDERVLVGLHVSRFVGFVFIWLHSRGELPWAFAVPGGVGDIVVAVLALLLIATLRSNTPGGRRAYLAWNAVGLIDILFVVATAARLGTADPSSMAALFRFPLSLVPTWLVPLIIASHVLLFVRLLRREP